MTLNSPTLYYFNYSSLPEFDAVFKSLSLFSGDSRLKAMQAKKRSEEYKWSRYLLNELVVQQFGLQDHLQIHINQQGKPALKNCDFKFNLSHSQKSIVIALAKEDVGVDIESLTKKNSYLKIAQEYFSEKEFQLLKACESEKLLQEKFIKLWSMKEAAYKLFSSTFDAESVRFYFDLDQHKIDQMPAQWQDKGLFVCNFKHQDNQVSFASCYLASDLKVVNIEIDSSFASLSFHEITDKLVLQEYIKNNEM